MEIRLDVTIFEYVAYWIEMNCYYFILLVLYIEIKDRKQINLFVYMTCHVVSFRLMFLTFSLYIICM